MIASLLQLNSYTIDTSDCNQWFSEFRINAYVYALIYFLTHEQYIIKLSSPSQDSPAGHIVHDVQFAMSISVNLIIETYTSLIRVEYLEAASLGYLYLLAHTHVHVHVHGIGKCGSWQSPHPTHKV